MFKSIQWKTFPRDFLIIQFGFALFGLSLALMIRGNLGTGAWSVLEVAISQRTGLTPGTLTVIVGFTVLVIAMALGEPVGWGTLFNILFIGPWEDLFLWLIPSVHGALLLQAVMLLGSVAVQGVASAVYIGVNAGAGPRDSLMLAVQRASRLSLRVARGIIEVGVFFLGWALGGPAGVGTLVFAVLIGPAVQRAFHLFRVQVHDSGADAAAEAGAE
ncbi:MAG: hypothetical protein JETCAE02_08580 [Anaerolineaceae bacterium]|jgi:uncharacterized membrane protein YczE|nr:hypothetical protein [Anaerolineales bacterium]MCC7512596.1 hypothetical protein [Anaerolineae bacterium]NOG76127.1 hypothetical protein [Chloroflexota bacterium]GER80858.1 conserved hypothetical protein [Candidatus Denitrolinea symbiosum]GJQ38446.1 MAG: hypothetical protein JETCAE02_08580 [Anaerolineaceae bacterium]